MAWKKLFTALRGGVNEGVEAVADSQAMRILDQEIRDAKQELIECNANLTKIMAKRKMSESKIKSISSDIETYTGHAISASEKGDEALALECAEKVAHLETQLADEQTICDQFQQSEQALKKNIAQATTSVKGLERQIEQVKATAAVQKAQEACSARHIGANSKVSTALDSLDRLKTKQAERSAQLEAANELSASDSGSDLDAKLKQAGITPGGQASGQDKLAELLARKKA